MTMLDLDPRHLTRLQHVLATHAAGAEVWAYGSRVAGTAHAGSDIDLVIRFPGAGGVSLSRLKGAIEASDLPLLTDIHLWDQLPERFREEIVRNHVVVQQGAGDL